MNKGNIINQFYKSRDFKSQKEPDKQMRDRNLI